MALSKNVVRASCAQILHPWTRQCWRAQRTIMVSSFLGSVKLFTPVFLVECVLRLRNKKKINKEMARELLTDFLQALTMGTSISTLFIFNSCMFRHLLGRYTYLSIVFMPGFLAGFSYTILKPKLRVQLFSTITNAALESVVLKASNSGLLSLNVYNETIFFMITNACLMYFSKTSESNRSNCYTWFYKPDKTKPIDDDKLFLKTTLKKIQYYFGLGLGLGILRTIIKDASVLAPRNVHKLLDTSTLKAGFFTGSYVTVYELTVYILNRYFKKDQSVYALPAGFLAGLSYAISPSLTINLSNFINLIQLVYGCIEAQPLRRLPANTIMFCLSAGVLFHIQLFHPKSISKVGSKFIKVVTGKKSNLMIEALGKLNHNVF